MVCTRKAGVISNPTAATQNTRREDVVSGATAGRQNELGCSAGILLRSINRFNCEHPLFDLSISQVAFVVCIYVVVKARNILGCEVL
jgi:hypothetical protein